MGVVHYILCVATGGHQYPEVQQAPDIGERNHDCVVLSHELLAFAINSEKVHTLASIVLIQNCLEPIFVTQVT